MKSNEEIARKPEGMTAAKPIRLEHAQWFAEMEKADARLRAFPDWNGRQNIHKPSAAAMRWAIALAGTDLNALSAGDLSNLQFEMDCFRRFHLDKPFPWQDPGRKRPNLWYFPALFSKDMMRDIQQWLQQSLEAIEGRQTVSFDAPAQVRMLDWWVRSGHFEDGQWVCDLKDGKWVYHVGGPVTDAEFRGDLFDLLKKHADDIRRCPLEDCRRIYLRDRSNQIFCSHRHQARHAKRIAENISPERFGKRGRPVGRMVSKKRPAGKGKGRVHATKRRAR
jgi:hypothetical protein